MAWIFSARFRIIDSEIFQSQSQRQCQVINLPDSRRWPLIWRCAWQAEQAMSLPSKVSRKVVNQHAEGIVAMTNRGTTDQRPVCWRGCLNTLVNCFKTSGSQMDQKFPFTSYDFWAYLSGGFLLLFAIDSAAGAKLLMRDNWTVVQGVAAVSIAYAVGQLVASLSSLVFERGLVGKVLGYPRNVLFGQPKAPSWLRVLLGAYFQPLPAETQAVALKKGEMVGVKTPGEALFWSAYAYARQEPAVMARLENFLNLYGFCRNTALVAFIDAAVLYWSYMQPNGPSEHLLWARLSFVVGIGMTLRYLKFYRLYANEVFTAYAYSKDKEPEKPP